MKIEKIWDKTYSAPKNIKKLPWVRTTVPEWFKETIDAGWVGPSKTLDLGCGNGYYSAYLSKKGFKVTGIDISKDIILLAKESYFENLNLRFKQADVFSKSLLKEKYSFLLDIGLFHNILPERRKEYAKRLSELLESKGKLLLFCFDKREKTFTNKKIYLNTLINVYSYPLKRKEIIEAFKPFFVIEKITPLRYGTNNYKRRFLCFLKKRS